MLFIAWEQKEMFRDTIEAMMWERTQGDAHRIMRMWEHVFHSRWDPATFQVRSKDEPQQ